MKQLNYQLIKIYLYISLEDNGKSVMTDTKKTWGLKKLSYENFDSKIHYILQI